eukprot:scaffold158148_cov30-Tisochrysis_lutea.AAC.6
MTATRSTHSSAATTATATPAIVRTGATRRSSRRSTAITRRTRVPTAAPTTHAPTRPHGRATAATRCSRRRGARLCDLAAARNGSRCPPVSGAQGLVFQ